VAGWSKAMQLVKSSANAWSDTMQPVVLPRLIAIIEATRQN